MKKIFLLLMAISLSSCSQDPGKQFSKESLNEKLVALNNDEITFGEILKKHHGKTVVIEVWASWCSDCIKAMPKWKALQEKHPDISYVLLSVDRDSDSWKVGIDKHELEGDHYWIPDGMKGTFGKAIDIDWIPRYIIVDKTGKVATYRAIETDFDQIDKTLTQIK